MAGWINRRLDLLAHLTSLYIQGTGETILRLETIFCHVRVQYAIKSRDRADNGTFGRNISDTERALYVARQGLKKDVSCLRKALGRSRNPRGHSHVSAPCNSEKQA